MLCQSDGSTGAECTGGGCREHRRRKGGGFHLKRSCRNSSTYPRSIGSTHCILQRDWWWWWQLRRWREVVKDRGHQCPLLWSYFSKRQRIIEVTWSHSSYLPSDSSSSSSSSLCGPPSGPEDDEGFSQPAPIKSRDEVLLEVRLVAAFIPNRKWNKTTAVSVKWRHICCLLPWSLGAASGGGTQSVIARRRRAAACRNSLQYYTTAWWAHACSA